VDKLTNKCNFVITQLYKIHLDRLEDGMALSRSKKFGSAKSINENFFIGWDLDTLCECINELDEQGLLTVFYASDKPVRVSLENQAIFTMENLHKKNIQSVVKELTKLKTLISF